jgi:hypothetical protein
VTGLGNFIYSILVLIHTSDRHYGSIFLVCDFVQLTGPDVWKTTFLAIILERAAATIFYKVYETKAPIALGIILQLLGVNCYLKNIPSSETERLSVLKADRRSVLVPSWTCVASLRGRA